MAARVERTSRSTRSDILNEGKSTRSYVGPLSDASNKSSDSNISCTIIIQETIRIPSKPVSMFNTGMKPRLSPKPFTREKPPENRRTAGSTALSADMKSQNDVPFQTSTSISLSGSAKSEDHERVGRRIFTSTYQPDDEEDQSNKSDVFSSSILSRKLTSSSWTPTDIGESKSASQTNEPKLTSKPPLVSRKPDVVEQQEKVYASSFRRPSADATDEQKDTKEKAKNNSLHSESLDSLTVRAQLRQKRRPVSAMFLDSVSDQASDNKTDNQRHWSRRPLSEDLTSLFESGAIGIKKESPFEETKENRPLRKSSLNSSFTEDQSDLAFKVGEFSKNTTDETRTGRSGITSQNVPSEWGTKDTITETRSSTEQEKTITMEVDSIVRSPVNNHNFKALPDYTDGSKSEIKNDDDSGIAPGTMKRRISLYLANSSSSLDSSDPPTIKEKHTSTAEKKTRAIVSAKDMEFGRPPSALQYQTADVATKVSTSFSNVESKSENIDGEKTGLASEVIGVQKDTNNWRTSEFSEDKRLRPGRSFRKVEDPLQLQNNEVVFKDRKSHIYKDKQYDNTPEETEEKNKEPVYSDNKFRTVKATMFEHNVEWHSPPELLSSKNPKSNQPARSDRLPESTQSKKVTESWSKWLTEDGVHSVTQLHTDSDISDISFSSSRVGKAASVAEPNVLQNLKVDEKRRIEPKFEVIKPIGERVLSESIKMAPEDKAVTLRSRRSFHNKERELESSEVDENGLRRPVSSLQRSKSEYRRREPSSQEGSTIKYGSRDLDFSFSRKNSLRAAKSDSVKPSDVKTHETVKNIRTVDTTLSDFQPKSYKLDYKPKKENTLGEGSREQSPFGISATDSKDMKKSLFDYPQKPFSDLVVKGLEAGKRTNKAEPALSDSNIKEDMRNLLHIEEPSNRSYQLNRYLSGKESTKKDNKDESNYLISEMLSNEVEQFKKNLTATHITEDSDSSRGEQFKAEYAEEFQWKKKKTPLPDMNTSSSSAGNPSDLYNFEYEGTKRKPNISTTSPTESKVTYFAITGLDNKKEKNHSNFESQSSPASSWTSEQYFNRDVRMSTTVSSSDSSSNKPEAINTQGDLGTSSAFKELKTHSNLRVLEADIVGTSTKHLEKKSDIDIDAFIKRYKQKTSLDDKRSLAKDSKPEQKIFSTDSSESSPLKLDGSYKSKAVDVDSLMADYNANHPKERVSRDEDPNISKWERSTSFRESFSKSSGSKWRNPSARHVNTDESYQNEYISSWYSSQTTTSTTEETKLDSHKISSIVDHIKPPKGAKYEEYREKGRDQGFQAHSEWNESRSIATSDSSQSSVRNFDNTKSRSARALESPTTLADSSTSRALAKTTVVEMSVDVDSKEDSAAAKPHHRISEKTDRKAISTEERQPPSEGRRPGKASDLISLMLVSKEKRMEHHRARQSTQVDHQSEQRTYRSKSQQERHHSENKDYLEKESYRQHAKLQREAEIVMDLPRRKSLNRHREEDHLKQCFSRSSTSNKDTDSLVQDPDRQYETWSQDKQQTEDSCVTDSPSYGNSSRRQHSHSRLSSLSHTETDQHDSINEARDGSLDRCSMDLDSTEGTESTPSEAKSVDFSFIDQTSVLDSTALKNRVQLSRKSQRRAPSQSQRRSRLMQSSSQLAVIEDTDNPWTYTDSTEERPEKKEEVEEEEEKPQRSSVHSPRMPMFPGMDHSTLMAQLRKRQDAESSSESSPQVTKSPKSPLPHGTLGIKLLPTPADKQDKAAGESPQWLKELKSKKRQSQYENQS